MIEELQEKITESISPFIFERNDAFKREMIHRKLFEYLFPMKIAEYLIICDETNNSLEVINKDELKLDLYFKEIEGDFPSIIKATCDEYGIHFEICVP